MARCEVASRAEAPPRAHPNGHSGVARLVLLLRPLGIVLGCGLSPLVFASEALPAGWSEARLGASVSGDPATPAGHPCVPLVVLKPHAGPYAAKRVPPEEELADHPDVQVAATGEGPAFGLEIAGEGTAAEGTSEPPVGTVRPASRWLPPDERQAPRGRPG
jgi:hypothetical protein